MITACRSRASGAWPQPHLGATPAPAPVPAPLPPGMWSRDLLFLVVLRPSPRRHSGAGPSTPSFGPVVPPTLDRESICPRMASTCPETLPMGVPLELVRYIRGNHWPCKDPVVLCQNGSARSGRGRWFPSCRALGLEWQVRAERGQGLCVPWLLRVGNRGRAIMRALPFFPMRGRIGLHETRMHIFAIAIAAPGYPLAVISGNSLQGTHLLCTLLFIHSLVLPSSIHSFPCWCQAGWCLMGGLCWVTPSFLSVPTVQCGEWIPECLNSHAERWQLWSAEHSQHKFSDEHTDHLPPSWGAHELASCILSIRGTRLLDPQMCPCRSLNALLLAGAPSPFLLHINAFHKRRISPRTSRPHVSLLPSFWIGRNQ